MSDFPLCERAGLTVHKKETGNILTTYPPQIQFDWMIKASDVERLFESAPVVSGAYVDCFKSDKQWRMNQSEEFYPPNTHTARLLLLEPIQKPDTHESLLREFTDWLGKTEGNTKLRELVDRAKRLLNEK